MVRVLIEEESIMARTKRSRIMKYCARNHKTGTTAFGKCVHDQWGKGKSKKRKSAKRRAKKS
jgi:hypothetical protein